MYLNCRSHFSLNYGVLSPEELVRKAAGMGITRLALTDIHNVSGALDFVAFCQKVRIDPVLGVEFRGKPDRVRIGLAHNPRGFSQLTRLLTDWQRRDLACPAEAPETEGVCWIYPAGQQPPRVPRPDEWIGVLPRSAGQWAFQQRMGRLDSQWAEKALAWQPVTFSDRAGFDLHRLLRCVHRNELLSKLRPEDHARPEDLFLAPGDMVQAFSDMPGLIFRSEMLLESCSFSFSFSHSRNKQCFGPSHAADLEHLRQLAEDGFRYRYPAGTTRARGRLEKELDIIQKLGFVAYFLITWDIVRFARSRGFFHVGRGSGANSITAYCLGITDVDPIELDLYFERFINPHRSSPPDFDLDFSWDEREEVQQYIFRTYPPGHVALLGSYVTYQENSIVRELGKVFGLTGSEIDRMSADPDYAAGTRTAGWIRRFGNHMKDMPRHLSIHAGGVLISEEPVYNVTALHYPPKGMATTHFDMYVAEDAGFAKFDILSQRGLGHIREAAELVYENQGLSIDVHAVQRFRHDERIRRQLRSGETLGCFYIESPGMRQLLSKLRCDDYLTLVAASSIIRPGVARSGMMKAYIHRFHNPGSFEYIHPAMESLLKETYGVMVYQEDVIKVAHHFAGLSLAESDVLRRAMSGKFRSREEFRKIQDKYFRCCAGRGYDESVAREVWRQIESFSGYSFSKAHSASYAVESYQSLFLKAWFPREFMVAVINNFGGFYHTEIYVHEARRSGACIEAPCVNRSRFLTSIQGETIFLGLVHIKGLEREMARNIADERVRNGPFRSLAQFCRRTDPGPEQLVLLVRAGAFRFSGLRKKELLWEAYRLCQAKRPGRGATGPLLPFAVEGEEKGAYALPPLQDDHELEDAYDQLEILGFSLISPFVLADWSEEDCGAAAIPAGTVLQHITARPDVTRLSGP
jgi:DNA-directed DNA polymerase III PolC